MIILITGGQRSGKSRYAEELALTMSPNPVYLATAHVSDEEFAERVKAHQRRRGPQWTNLEEEKTLSRFDLSGRVVVVDCITLWLSNFFFDSSLSDASQPTTGEALDAAKKEFDKLVAKDASFIVVTNEIGCGGTSQSAVQRRFTDLQGWFNQYVAGRADKVIMMVCGIPVTIKK